MRLMRRLGGSRLRSSHNGVKLSVVMGEEGGPSIASGKTGRAERAAKESRRGTRRRARALREAGWVWGLVRPPEESQTAPAREDVSIAGIQPQRGTRIPTSHGYVPEMQK